MAAQPRIWVICPDYAAPSGGIRKLYRHVDVLTQHGFDAAIVHQQRGFRCTWFEHQTPIEYAESISMGRHDVVVVPEILGPQIANLAPGIRKVVFNQNCYFTFRGYPPIPGNVPLPYHHPDVIAVLTVSEDSRQYLQFAFPHQRVRRIRYGIDFGLFAPAPVKQRQIAYMPRKNGDDVAQVIHILRARQTSKEFELLPIDNIPEVQVAKHLATSALFLTFGNVEGFGLPAAEAMASGCLVVGYHGLGGKEFFQPEFSWPVPIGDIQTFVATIEEVVELFLHQPSDARRRAYLAASYIRTQYSLENEAADIVGFWREVMGHQSKSFGNSI